MIATVVISLALIVAVAAIIKSMIRRRILMKRTGACCGNCGCCGRSCSAS
ncbi:MAG: FeoB-associated Cys-rich membrane protein [Bacteroides sp.]|nr:FeoB-associated Cys-rich membrane protein [Prevotella sp.]MCM1408731.1 FeoB-associated Cys-rich membrane protein [Treponema brennaborense]MCM1470646.1 FeoB-associated Cys-rich membrane protein [Bacteroides sp.]